MLNVISGILSGGATPDNGQFESIATVTVGAGGSASVDFTSIPSTYKHLQIRCLLKDTTSGSTDDPAIIRFNGDSGSNYSNHGLYGTGSSASTIASAPTSYIFAYGTPSNNFSNVFGAAIIDILDYTDTNKYKTTRWLNGFDANTTPSSIDFYSGSWRNTAAISSIQFLPVNNNWAQYSSFALYGIKG